jgi:branched-chain amino acid transport system ATP-binding protein
VLLVEQHVSQALDVADRAYLMRRGKVEMAGTAEELRERQSEIQALYLSSAQTAPAGT